MSEEYLTVAEAATRLGISPRAVQKRCAGGSITAQRIGGQWQVLALDAMRTGEPQSEHQDANRTDGARPKTNSKRTEPANERTIGREPNREPANQNEPRNELQNEPAAAALLAQSREEILFLRGLVEQRDRDAAELRAALRKALDAMPKALPVGSTPEEAQKSPEKPVSGADFEAGNKAHGGARIVAQKGRKREISPFRRAVARVLGIRLGDVE
jgi:excisionase family DNA binding protein